MRLFLTISLLLCYLLTLAGEMDKVRMQFHDINSKESLLAYIDMVSAVENEKAIPYKEAAAMRRAQFTSNPYKKLKYFNAGKKRLESYISANPFDIEARYIRALIQSDVPEMLNYNEQLKSDIEYIFDNLEMTTLSDEYKKLIKETLHKQIEKKQ